MQDWCQSHSRPALFIGRNPQAELATLLQGTSYNAGRMAGAIAPYTIGAVATLPGVGIGIALGVTSAFFVAAALLVFTLPDKSGQPLE